MLVAPSTNPALYFDTDAIHQDDIDFEHAEVARYHNLMEEARMGLRPRRFYWAGRVHESQQLLSLMAPDEGIVNQDARI